jgi:hypothetical protein
MGEIGKVLCLAVKFSLRILQMDKEVLLRECYEWQINNSKFKISAKNLKRN